MARKGGFRAFQPFRDFGRQGDRLGRPASNFRQKVT